MTGQSIQRHLSHPAVAGFSHTQNNGLVFVCSFGCSLVLPQFSSWKPTPYATYATYAIDDVNATPNTFRRATSVLHPGKVTHPKDQVTLLP